MKEMRWLRMRWRDCVLCGCVEPSFVPRVESSCGVVWVADWLEAAFCAWARDAAKVVDVGDLSAKAKADLIVPELTEELLHHLLRAWYRLSVYQQQLSRSSLPIRPHLFLMLRSLVQHPSADISDLAAGLLVLYQPDTAAEVQALVQAAPSTAATAELPPATRGGASTVTAHIRAEFELARSAEAAQQRLRRGEKTAKAQLADGDTNGVESADAAPSPTPTPAVPVVEQKGQEEVDRAATPLPRSSTPSASPAPPLAVSSSSLPRLSPPVLHLLPRPPSPPPSPPSRARCAVSASAPTSTRTTTCPTSIISLSAPCVPSPSTLRSCCTLTLRRTTTQRSPLTHPTHAGCAGSASTQRRG